MQKNYKIDGSLGQITNKLEDKIQEGGGLSLRERSFEELINFIPKGDYLVETINGVSLEYLIKNEPCKIFSEKTNGQNTIFHIFSDKIITSIPDLNKIFVDIIPENFTAEVSSISTCFKISDKGQERLIFNSIRGIYFCSVLPIKNSISIANGKPYFDKIEIPSETSGESIESVVGNVYVIRLAKNDGYDNNGSLYLTLDLDEVLLEGSDKIYLEGNLKIGDKISLSNISITKDDVIDINNALVTKSVQALKYTRDNQTLVYPKIPPIPIKPTPNNIIVDIPSTTTQIVLFQISFFPNYTTIQNNKFKFETYKFFCTRYRYFNIPNIFGWVRDAFCFTTANTKINILNNNPVDTTIKLAPYTPYSLSGRLAVSYNNIVKFSKTGDYTNFNFNPQSTPTETDAFTRTLQDVDEITFISKWGEKGSEQGFLIGTTKNLIPLTSIANLFSTAILPNINIPCSYIPPIEIKYQTLTASLIVGAGRTKITAVVFTRDQRTQINLTEIIDFFETDPIKKLQVIEYGNDQMVFVLTDNSNLYACLTGGSRLAWFKINLTYKIEDIASFDGGLNKKLYIISNLQNSSKANLVGSIDFTEGIQQIKAEYFTNSNLQDDNIFSNEIPILGEIQYYKLKEELTNNEKLLLTKPIIGKLTLHNQEIINKNYNTKASKTKRKILNVNINVKNSNYFTVKYICQDNNAKSIIKNAYSVQRNDDNLNPKRVKELIQIFQGSPASDNVKLSIETDKNSIVPLTIQSISFDTEYVNIK